MNFTPKDIDQFKEKGLTEKQVNQQLELFKTGLPFINLQEAATVGHGIVSLPKKEQDRYVRIFKSRRNQLSFVKFTPASGAATRMFKFLFKFLNDFDPNRESINSYINRERASDLSIFHIGIKKFPFYYMVKRELYKYFKNYDDLSSSERFMLFVKTMLDADQLNYGDLPKGLLPFHQYKDHIATAFEEHLFEAVIYASAIGKANLHFTISENHEAAFQSEFEKIKQRVQKQTNTQFNVTYSYQKQSTDTIAVTLDNLPYRNEEGTLLFRPSGHGALLDNLNQMDADIIFIKNIDNVVVSSFKNEVGYYKMMLAGILIELQQAVFEYQRQLEKADLSESNIHEVVHFISEKLNVVISDDFEKYSSNYQIDYLKSKLDRPIRVCGMVKNEGEPGGGPFWVKGENGTISLQIVESSQVDKKNKQQKELFSNATHFNPVDLVCSIKNYKGETYDLGVFVDPKAAFITKKTVQGNEIKALELPGLWNGSMSDWNTIFVEVPLITFNPVKTVNDLLKETHQTT